MWRQLKHQRRLVHLAGRPFDYFFKTIEKAIRHVLSRHAAKFLKPPEELLRLQAAGHRNLRIAWDGFAVELVYQWRGSKQWKRSLDDCNTGGIETLW